MKEASVPDQPKSGKQQAAQPNFLAGLDYSVVQQCMHCGMCLPTCPTYDETLNESSSPRGRIALMRGIADGRLDLSKKFADEMYFCLGCLACQTACPAGVDYANLFENARAQIESSGVLAGKKRSLIRQVALNWLFVSPRRLRLLGKLLYAYQRSGLERAVRRSGLLRLLPESLRELEPLTPRARRHHTGALYQRRYSYGNPAEPRYRVALLAGCIQDIAFSEINADTFCVLQANGCQVALPEKQACCGSLHAHNGETGTAKDLARRNIDAFRPEELDAVIVNAGGCGSHMKHYDHLLDDDPDYAARARVWTSKVKDIHEFLAEIGIRAPRARAVTQRVTYHESCHLKHGQKIAQAPRQVLEAVPGLELVELPESDWCCGSAGIYNITQPEMSMKLLDRKMEHVQKTKAPTVATANPGCAVQLMQGGRRAGVDISVVHPVSLLAEAYRAEEDGR